MKSYKAILILVTLFILFNIIYNQSAFGSIVIEERAADESFYKEITVFQADSLIAANAGEPSFVIIDLRTLGEFASGHIENAVNINFYSETFNTEIGSLDRNKIYLIYCASGGRSGSAFALMQDLNFLVVYNMLGGINQWTGSGLPVVTSTASNFIREFKPGLIISIFPNPAHEILNLEIENSCREFTIEIMDITGKILYKNVSNSNQQITVKEINISGYHSGIHFVRVILQDYCLTKRILVY